MGHPQPEKSRWLDHKTCRLSIKLTVTIELTKPLLSIVLQLWALMLATTIYTIVPAIYPHFCWAYFCIMKLICNQQTDGPTCIVTHRAAIAAQQLSNYALKHQKR